MSTGSPAHARRGAGSTRRDLADPRVARTGVVVAAWAACVLVARLLRPGRFVHTAAVGIHLAYLTLGFGTVLLVDAMALAVLAGCCPLPRLASFAEGASPLIFGCWAGLLASGTLLHPDLGSTLTQIKLAAVLLIAVNGLFVDRIRRRLGPSRDCKPSTVPSRQALIAGLVSQAAWWVAILIGWHNKSF